MPPYKPRWPARSGGTIYVTVKDIISVRDDGKVFVARLGVGNAPGAGRSLKIHLVAANGVVARLVLSTNFHRAVLVYQNDPAPANCNRQRIAVHLHILRCGDKDLGTPEPPSATETSVLEDIVANDRFVRDLVKDPCVVIALHEVTFVQDIPPINIPPQPGTNVVLNMIPPKHPPS